MSNPRRRLVRILTSFAILGLVLFSAGFFLRIGPGGGGELATIKLQDGSAYKVSQRFNWSSEPYSVTFYIRQANGQWTGHYIHHQALRWREVQMNYDATTDTIFVTEAGTLRIRYDRRSRKLWYDNGQWSREVIISYF